MIALSDYDKWKTQCPDGGRTCDRHGDWLVQDPSNASHWYCPTCEVEDAQKCETWEQREKYLATLNESEAVKKAMRRFWRRLDEVEAKKSVRSASQPSDNPVF